MIILHILFTGDSRLVRILIENGADVNLENGDNETALHIATVIGREEIVELLVKNNAEVNRRNRNEKTALDIAIEKGTNF